MVELTFDYQSTEITANANMYSMYCTVVVQCVLAVKLCLGFATLYSTVERVSSETLKHTMSSLWFVKSCLIVTTVLK